MALSDSAVFLEFVTWQNRDIALLACRLDYGYSKFLGCKLGVTIHHIPGLPAAQVSQFIAASASLPMP